MNDKQIVAQGTFELSPRDIQRARYLRMMLPNGDDLTDENALALDAYGKLHGLDPLNGEAYYLVKVKKDDRGNVISRTELGCYPGIKGKRKKSKEQLRAQDPQSTYKIDYAIVDPADIGMDPGDTAIVVRGELRDSISEGNYIIQLLKLTQAGFGKDEIGNILGKPPRWIGYGAVRKSELRYIKMSAYDLARKRAESSCTSQRFDLPFADGTAEDLAPDIENGDGSNEPPLLETEVAEGKFSIPFSEEREAQLQAELGF